MQNDDAPDLGDLGLTQGDILFEGLETDELEPDDTPAADTEPTEPAPPTPRRRNTSAAAPAYDETAPSESIEADDDTSPGVARGSGT